MDEYDKDRRPGEDGSAHQEMDDFKHSKMLEMLAGKKKGPTKSRIEASGTVSEYFVSTADTAKVDVGDLLSSIKRSVNLAAISRQVEKKLTQDKTKVLPSPLSTEEANAVTRQIAFGKVCKEVSKWEKLVLQNRQAEQLRFPLNQLQMKRDGLEQLASRHSNKTPLELEMEALLGQSKDPEPDSEEMKRRKMTRIAFQEAMELRKNMSRIRARQSYYEEKARRAKKIKSKTYHRILKKERLKTEVKNFEALSKSNPELAEEKLQELDKKRIMERMSLRHKNTGKWAKYMKMRAHHDKETSRAIQEQIDISRTLTEKMFVAPDEDDDDPAANGVFDDDELPLNMGSTWQFRGDASNPWMTGRGATRGAATAGASETEGEGIGYREYWEQENQRRLAANEPPLDSSDASVLKVPSSHLDDIVLKRQVKSHRPKEDQELVETSVGKTGSKKMNITANGKHDAQANAEAMQEKKKCRDAPGSNGILKQKSETISVSKKKPKAPATDKKIKSVKFLSSDEIPDTDDVDLIFASVLSTKLSGTNEGKRKRLLGSDKKNKRTPLADDDVDDVEASKDEDLISESSTRRNPMAVSDVTPSNPKGRQLGKKGPASKLQPQPEEDNEEVDIDPNNFITVKTATINVSVPDGVDYDNEAMDDVEQNEDVTADDVSAANHHRMTLAEAFADDDVVEEFKVMKQAIVEEDTPKPVDRSLPGWGTWGGAGIKISKRKRLRFTEPPAKAKKREDRKLANVIINDSVNPKLAEQQVTKLPTAFNTRREFEKYMKAPLGNDCNPVLAYKKLIAPKVITKKGAIIEPMNQDALDHDLFEKKDVEDFENEEDFSKI